jgi:hypothetical protein
MNEREKPFSVTDRRHFTAEGQPREEDAAPAPAAEASGTPGGPEASANRPDAEDAAGGAEAASRSTAPVDFSQFLLSLGAQAAALLSGATPENSGQRTSALEGARSVIAILEMLRDKTEGRRSGAEDQLLEGLLFELRMAFVERAGQK